MGIAPFVTWTVTAQRRNAPLSRFNPVHPKASNMIWMLARHLEAITGDYGCKAGRGWDSSSTEHNTGRALDWIISTAVGVKASSQNRVWIGDLVVDWLISVADHLHIRHIIWNRRIWKRRFRGTATEWTRLTGRSGVSDWHEDHIHLLLDDERGYIPDWPLTNTIVSNPKKEVDLMSGITKQELAEIVQANTRASIINYFETGRYAEYVDENGNAKQDVRTLADIIFATHAHSVSANRAVVTLAAANGLPVKELVNALMAELTPLVKRETNDDVLADKILKGLAKALLAS